MRFRDANMRYAVTNDAYVRTLLNGFARLNPE